MIATGAPRIREGNYAPPPAPTPRPTRQPTVRGETWEPTPNPTTLPPTEMMTNFPAVGYDDNVRACALSENDLLTVWGVPYYDRGADNTLATLLMNGIRMVALFMSATLLLNSRVQECRWRDEHTRLLYICSQYFLSIEAGVSAIGNLDRAISVWHTTIFTYMSVSCYAGFMLAMALSFAQTRHHR
jgi:hypothetical protein